MDGRRVLIVDGDREAGLREAEFLARRGCIPQAVGSAAEALACLARHRFDCAVVDVELEDVSGLRAIPMLQRLAPALPVVVTATTNTRELEAEVRRHEVVYYYLKTFDRAELCQAVESAAGGGHMSERPTILVVDDDRDYQAAMRQLLEAADYEVVSAHTKDEGLAALKQADPALIILDIMMTKATDGFHFLYEMKSEAGGELPPVLSVSCVSEKTGYQFSPTTDEDYFPVEDFLEKPVDPSELLKHLERLLAQHRPSSSSA